MAHPPLQTLTLEQALDRINPERAGKYRNLIRRAGLHHALAREARDDIKRHVGGAEHRLLKHLHRSSYMTGWVDGLMRREPALVWYDVENCMEAVVQISDAQREALG